MREGQLCGKAWQSTPVFLPGEFHGQRSLAGYSPWGHKESDTTEVTACYSGASPEPSDRSMEEKG